ncbi:MAG TPA: VOC family protein [Pseudonocardiaceae bacterium]|jgi:predicted enzyme related to lactoylglutathione lyase|nr:VOC family protein [Pseudonocardiaceae bacterium]
MTTMASRIVSLPIDCVNAELVAAFWADVLGWQVVGRGSYGVSIGGSDTHFEIDFRTVPEPKKSKNRLHLDINPTDRDQAAELERLLALGATPVAVGQGTDVSWHVLADPEGNEFCLCRATVDP